MRRAGLALATALLTAACTSGPDGAGEPAYGVRERPILNGQRAPRIVPLSEGEQLAIGWLHEPGFPGGNFCTGTVVAPRVVATAAHCTEGRGPRDLGFGVGLLPERPTASVRVAEIHEHPNVDAALLVLAEDITARVPALRPIPFNRVPLDASLVGREVEAAGYGETRDPSRSGRYFAVVLLTRVTERAIFVDGRGVEGICFGDSGGPVLTTDPSGRVVVLAVEHGGDESCVGVDQLTRLDPLTQWIEGVAGVPVDSPGGGCGTLDYLGRCDGDVATWCDDGQVARMDCGASGLPCGWVDDEVGWYCQEPTECGDVGAAGVCEGDVRVTCRDGALQREACAETGRVCRADAAGALCARPAGEPEPEPDPDPVDPGPAEDPDEPAVGGGDPPPTPHRGQPGGGPERPLAPLEGEPEALPGELTRGVEHDGAGGCQLGPGPAAAPVWVLALLLGGLRRRRPRAPRTGPG